MREPAAGTPPMVDTPEALAESVAALAAGTGPFAVDAERAAGYRFSSRAYLIQIRREGSGTHLIDPIPLSDFGALAEVMATDEWILHAASQDLPCLHELGLAPPTVFDTELAGRLLGRPHVGLGAMVAEDLQIVLAKEHSAYDWSIRPLPPSVLNYAALDVEHLHELRGILAAQLTEAGKDEWAREEFEAVRLAPDPGPHPDPWRRTHHLGDVTRGRGLAVVRELWLARREVAERLDISPGRVLPDRAIVALASKNPLPPELPSAREFRRHDPEAWAAAYAKALAIPEAELPPRRGPSRGGLPEPRVWKRLNPPAAARIAAIRERVREIGERHTVPQENLLPPAAQRRLAWEFAGGGAAEVREALLAAGARAWQVDLTADELAQVLASAEVPARENSASTAAGDGGAPDRDH